MVKDGRLTSAHGRTLLAIKDEQQMLRLAKRVVKEKWSVRYLENHVNELKCFVKVGNRQSRYN